MKAEPVDLKTRSLERFSWASYNATRSSLPSNVTSATTNFARCSWRNCGPVVSHVDSENVSPSALASRTVIFRLASPTGSCKTAISDLPGPLKSPLAATLVPKTPTDRTSVSGRGVGLGVGVGDAATVVGSVLGDGRVPVQAVRTATDKAISLKAA